MDRWITGTPWVARALHRDGPVVDLGFGSSPITTIEWARRLTEVRPDKPVIGLDIDPERVSAAKQASGVEGLEFRRGGFELAGLTEPVLVRALNVLRQYTESEA